MIEEKMMPVQLRRTRIAKHERDSHPWEASFLLPHRRKHCQGFDTCSRFTKTSCFQGQLCTFWGPSPLHLGWKWNFWGLQPPREAPTCGKFSDRISYLPKEKNALLLTFATPIYLLTCALQKKVKNKSFLLHHSATTWQCFWLEFCLMLNCFFWCWQIWKVH